MKKIMFLLGFAVCCAQCFAVERYVSLNGTNDVSGKFIDWVGAATTIQAAVNVCNVGDLIWVSNGIYAVGATVAGDATNRVYIDKAIAVCSWSNDRAHTIIQGGTGYRPVYMVAGSSLIGFTVTNGVLSASHGGGIRCASTNVIISNCVITANLCPGSGGGVYRGTLYNCEIIANSAQNGGGVYEGVLQWCNVSGNYASAYGGGVNRCYVYGSEVIANKADAGGGGGYGALAQYYMTNCVLIGNSSSGSGGGVSDYNLYNCDLIGNVASNNAGGANSFSACNCLIISNTAGNEGGGARQCDLFYTQVIGNQAGAVGGGCSYSGVKTITNCLIAGNQSGTEGGGVYGGTWVKIYNTTISGNSAANYGGIYRVALMVNSISWSNRSAVGADDGSYTAYYSCGVGFAGNGNLASNPNFVDPGAGFGTNHVVGNYRLQHGSPCINRGTNDAWMNVVFDLDGRARQDRFSRLVDMGCYEYVPKGFLWIGK